MTDRPAKGNTVTEPVDRSSNKVTREGRHKGVPPQVVRGPSLVAKKAGGHITGPRGLAREGGEGCAKLSAVAQVVAQQRAELDALSASPSTPQIRGKPSRAPTRDGAHLAKDPSWQREEWVVGAGKGEASQPAKILTVVVRQSSPEPQELYVKRPCQPRPRALRCDDVPARWKTQELKDTAKAVLREVRDALYRQAAGSLIRLEIGKGIEKEITQSCNNKILCKRSSHGLGVATVAARGRVK